MALRRRSLLLATTSVGALLVLTLGTSATRAAWTAASVQNPTSSTSAATLAFIHAYGSTTCATGPSSTSTAGSPVACTGWVGPATSPPATGLVSATDRITNEGTAAAAQLTQQVSASSCAPVKLDDTVGSDPLLPRYATSFRVSDPWGTTSAVSQGSGAYAGDVSVTSTASLLGGSYSVGVWFKVANGYAAGGALIGLAASAASASSAAGSPLVWLDNAGKVRFRISGILGTSSTAGSSTAYDDGSWHLVVLSVPSAVLAGPTLYVDGAAVATGAAITALTGGSAYWHVGWGDFTGAGNAPTSNTLAGSLAGAFVTGAAVGPTTVASLSGSASASAYSTAVKGLGSVAHLWMLGDSGTTTYTGSLPSSMTAPCGQVDVAFSFSSPTDAISSQSLAAFANGVARTVAAPGPGVTQTMTTSLSRGSGYSTDIAGLHLAAPLRVVETTVPTGSSWSVAAGWSDATAVFLG